MKTERISLVELCTERLIKIVFLTIKIFFYVHFIMKFWLVRRNVKIISRVVTHAYVFI